MSLEEHEQDLQIEEQLWLREKNTDQPEFLGKENMIEENPQQSIFNILWISSIYASDLDRYIIIRSIFHIM